MFAFAYFFIIVTNGCILHHTFLFYSFPDSISPDLKDLLTRLLKRNSNERITFEEFFTHPFLRKTASPLRPKPLSSPPPDIGKILRFGSNCDSIEK